MCLHYKYVYERPSMGFLVKCQKGLARNGVLGLTTPYQDAPVPENGMLIPSSSLVEVGWWGWDRDTEMEATVEKKLARSRVIKTGLPLKTELISGGCIHAFNEGASIYKSTYIHSYHEAYAFRVFAMSDSDLTCFALYIPDADKTGNKRKVMGEISRILSLDRWPRNSDFKRLSSYFPILKRLFPVKQGAK